MTSDLSLRSTIAYERKQMAATNHYDIIDEPPRPYFDLEAMETEARRLRRPAISRAFVRFLMRICVKPDDSSCPQFAIRSGPQAYSTTNYSHHFIPDLWELANSSYYWGQMDKYEAEKCLRDKPDGTYLVRDSVQRDFQFTVSFQRRGWTMHARVFTQNHLFTFDPSENSFPKEDSITNLIKAYLETDSNVFLAPYLKHPLPRKNVFSLQHLARSALSKNLEYKNVRKLPLPPILLTYLSHYFYRVEFEPAEFGRSRAPRTPPPPIQTRPRRGLRDASSSSQL